MSNTLIAGLLILVLFYIVNRLRNRNRKLNEPPVVPYKYPIICHTWDYENDTKNFLSKCRKEFGPIFTISVNGVVTTIVGREYIHEVFNSKYASFKLGTEDKIPFTIILGLTHNATVIPDVTKSIFNSKMHSFSDKIQRSFQRDIDELIGECKEPKVIRNTYKLLLELISSAATILLIGDKLCQDKELIAVFRDFSDSLQQAFKVPGYLGYIHPWIYKQSMIMRYRFGDNQVKKIQRTLMKKIRPIIDERLRLEQKCGDDWKRPVDCIQFVLDYPGVDKENLDYNWIGSVLLGVTFAATSTVMGATNILLDLAARQEYWNDLMEEQEKINPNNDEILSLDQISKMEKLDSFCKESLRLIGHEINLAHKIVNSDLTFSNGYQVPKGRIVGSYVRDAHQDHEYYGSDADEFDGYRFLGKGSPAYEVSRKFLLFGMGRHACPGRQFAITATKMIMIILMKKYKITTKSGKRPSNLMINGIGFPYPEPLIFEKR